MFELHELEELKKLSEELLEQQRKTDFDRLSRLEQEKQLRKEILSLLDRAAQLEKSTPEDQIQGKRLRIEAEQKQQQLDALQRRTEDDLPGLQNPFEVDARTQNNLRQSADTVPMLDIMLQIQRDQLQTQKQIRDRLTPRPQNQQASIMDQINGAFA